MQKKQAKQAIINRNNTIISRGAANNPMDVKEIQATLNRLDIRDKNGNKLAVDGNFGPLTESAVRNFQRSAGIQVTGAVGPQTRGAFSQRSSEFVGAGNTYKPHTRVQKDTRPVGPPVTQPQQSTPQHCTQIAEQRPVVRKNKSIRDALRNEFGTVVTGPTLTPQVTVGQSDEILGAQVGVSGSLLSARQRLPVKPPVRIYRNVSLGNLDAGGYAGAFTSGNIGMGLGAVASTARGGLDIEIPWFGGRTATVSPSVSLLGYGGRLGVDVNPATGQARKRKGMLPGPWGWDVDFKID